MLRDPLGVAPDARQHVRRNRVLEEQADEVEAGLLADDAALVPQLPVRVEDRQVDPAELPPEAGAPDDVRDVEHAAVLEERQAVASPHDAAAALDARLGQKNIRVNAVSAGPVRTLAARSIAGFPTMEAIVEERSPLHRHIEADDVGAAASYLLSDDAKNVTGTILYVDSEYHAMGM